MSVACHPAPGYLQEKSNSMFSTLSHQAAAGSNKTLPLHHLLQAEYTQLSTSLHSVLCFNPNQLGGLLWTHSSISVSVLYWDPGNGPRKAAELHRRIRCKLHHSPYDNKEAPGEECDFKVLMKREKGGLRRDGR